MPRLSSKVIEPYYPDHVWHELRTILHGLLGLSDTKCAKAMGVSRATWKAWYKTPPRNPWMVHSLYYCCFIHLHQYHGKYGSKKWKRHQRAVKQMSGMEKYFHEKIPRVEQIRGYSGCEKHLAKLLCHKGMYWEDIRKPANAGGYSPRMLQIAAHRIGVVMTSKGFGEDKESWWEWPTEPDEF